MKFYKLSHDLKSGKKYPQVDCLTFLTASQISPWKELLLNPNLKFKLKRGAVMTDYISSTAGLCCDMLISLKLYECIRHFNILPHQMFPTTIETNNGVLTYHLLHLYGPAFVDSIDYAASSFIRTEWTIPQDSILLESFRQYQQLKSQDKTGSFGITFDKLRLRKTDEIWDLFFPFPFDSTIFLSEKLAETLLESDYTGLSIEQTNKIIHV